MLMKLHRGITRTYEVIKIIILLFYKWPFSTWINFWITYKPETVVLINKIKVTIRTKNIFTKITDISMAYECILRDDYQLKKMKFSKGDVVLDIGAHIGSFSLAIAKQHPDIRILSFEPSPNSYRILRKNITINNYKNIVPFNKAVISKEKKGGIYLDPVNSALNSIYRSKGHYVKVPSISLEKIFRSNNIKNCAFIKMDCEGSEYDIILNTPLNLLRKIKAIVIEYHDPVDFGISNKKYTILNLVKHLKNAGFKCNANRMKNYQGILVASS